MNFKVLPFVTIINDLEHHRIWVSATENRLIDIIRRLSEELIAVFLSDELIAVFFVFGYVELILLSSSTMAMWNFKF